jgi:hypothetical protein
MIVLYLVNKIPLLKSRLFAFRPKPPHQPLGPRENGQGHCHCSTSMSLPPSGIVCHKHHQATSCCTAQGEIEQGYPAMDIVVHARRQTGLKFRLLPILHKRRYGRRWQRYTARRCSMGIVVHARRKRSQGHATANPAQETLQPPPLLRNENRADRTRDRLDIRIAAPSKGAQDTVKAGKMAAARAAAIAAACATTVEAQAASATAAGSHVSPAAPAQRKPLRPIRPKNVEMDSNDPWWGHRSLIDKAQYAHMQHQNDPYRDDLSKAKSSDETFYQDRINSKQALMDNHTELLIRLKGSNYQNRNMVLKILHLILHM